jgi:flavin reductase (DIM6/NTAB) family NADH-FMN oxidoreductase RutF
MIEPAFKEIDPQEILVNPFKLMLKDWMLVTAGPIDDYNTMTAGWGGLGGMWSKNAAMCVIRPTRYTFEFIEREENFTFCFFDEQYREALQFCGSKSGRDVPNKAVEAGLTPVAGILQRTTTFAEARMIMECRKIYRQDIDPKNFLDPKLEDWYPQKDYHRLYIGEIVNCLVR